MPPTRTIPSSLDCKVEDDLCVESFTAWILAAQLLSGQPAAAVLTMQSAATLLVQAPHSEHLIVLDSADHVVARAEGGADQVALDAKTINILKNGHNLRLIHNHPNGSSLSPADVQLLDLYSGITSVSAVTKSGTIYTVSHLAAGASKTYLTTFVKASTDGSSTNFLDVPHKVLTQLHKQGLLTYTVTRYK